jgi:hypothetical protein
MIEPLQPYNEAKYDFIVTDIENWPDGSVLCIDAAWREDDGIRHCRFDGWDDWWEWLLRMGRKGKKWRKVFAHNGGGWDWLSFIHWIIGTEWLNECIIDVVPAMSKLVVAKVVVKDRHTVLLCDSLQLLRSPLDSLAKTFLGRGKDDTGGLLPHELYALDRNRFDNYVRRDTESLLQVLECALDTIRTNVAKIDSFGPTIASTALKVFRTIYSGPSIAIPTDAGERKFLRDGYAGGRVECFSPSLQKRINVYDINSLYPHAMVSCQIPISDRTRWSKRFDPERTGVWHVEWKQYDRSIPPVLLLGGDGVYEGTGFFYTPELAALVRIDPRAKIEVVRGLVFTDVGKPFDEYVRLLFALRRTDKAGPLSLLCKYLLNSLYGKFGQRTTRKTIRVQSRFDSPTEYRWFIETNRPIELDAAKGVYMCQSNRVCNFEHVGIAGTITSQARSILYEGILSAIRRGGSVVYCDTDSVHTTGTMETGNGLGEFKLEFSGRGCYVGKKLYGLQAADGTEKIRAKGVSVGGRNGARLCFDDLVRMLHGERVRCEFKQSATLFQVMKGLTKPCVIGNMDGSANRIRTLKLVE